MFPSSPPFYVLSVFPFPCLLTGWARLLPGLRPLDSPYTWNSFTIKLPHLHPAKNTVSSCHLHDLHQPIAKPSVLTALPACFQPYHGLIDGVILHRIPCTTADVFSKVPNQILLSMSTFGGPFSAQTYHTCHRFSSLFITVTL